MDSARFTARLAARLAATLLPLAALTAAHPAGAQAPASDASFFDRIDVELVDLEVLVTDRNGQPVAGLEREDFLVFDDERPVALSHFAPHALAAVPAAAPAPATDTTAQAAVPPAELPAARPARGLVALFIDDASLPPHGRKRALEGLRPRLDGFLAAGDRLIVATWDSSLRIRRGLDPALATKPLGELLDEIEREAPGGLQALAERRELLRQIEMASLPPVATSGSEPAVARQDSSDMEAASMNGAVRLYLERRSAEGRATLLALERLVSSLAGLDGPKSVLILTGGLAQRPGEEMLEALAIKYASHPSLQLANGLDAAAFDLASQQRQLVERANAAGVVLHGFVVDSSGAAAEERGGALRPAELDNRRNFAALAGVGALAGPTGGLALGEPASSANWARRLLDERQGTYSLAWVATADPKASRARRVKVELRRSDLTARHRTTVRPLTREAEARSATMAALLLGDVVGETEIAILFGAIEPSAAAKGEIEVEIEVRFPLAQVVLLPGEMFHEGRVRLWVGAQDDRGQRSDLSRVEMPLRIANDELLTAQGKTAAWRSKLRLRPVRHVVAVGLDDEIGGTLTTARAVFEPPAQDDSPR